MTEYKHISKAFGTLAVWGSLAYILAFDNISGGTIGWCVAVGAVTTALIWED